MTVKDRARLGIVVLHDYYGLLPHVAEFAARLEHEGHTVQTPNLYEQPGTTEAAVAEDLMDALSRDTAVARARAAADQLRCAIPEIAVAYVGFSMGGSIACHAALGHAVAALVLYYASEVALVDRIQCPVLCHAAAVDDWPDGADPVAFADTLMARGVEATAVTYPGTEHSFANADVSAYAARPTADAHTRTIEFLHRILR